MINDKIVLLTIFLYITLSLRKVENFVDNGCKIEDFTQEEVPTERIMTASWSLLKLFILSGFMLKYITKEERGYLLFINGILIIGLLLFIILAYAMDKPEKWLTGVLAFETISNEYINVIFIYFIIKVSIAKIIPQGETSIQEIVGSLLNVLGEYQKPTT